MDFLKYLEAWHFTLAGFVLLGLEIAGAPFLLGIALSCFFTAGLIYWLDAVHPSVLVFFTFCSIFLSWVYVTKFKKFNDSTDRGGLNDATSKYVGRVLTLDQQILGEGTVVFGDTLWKVHCVGVLDKGQRVEVYAVEDLVLKIRPVQ